MNLILDQFISFEQSFTTKIENYTNPSVGFFIIMQ
jgi:hypothetical protein